jgi:hypothetical protein
MNMAYLITIGICFTLVIVLFFIKQNNEIEKLKKENADVWNVVKALSIIAVTHQHILSNNGTIKVNLTEKDLENLVNGNPIESKTENGFTIDGILDKISKGGIESLTPDELKFLKDSSNG